MLLAKAIAVLTLKDSKRFKGIKKNSRRSTICAHNLNNLVISDYWGDIPASMSMVVTVL